jgi:hypothetical protein
MEVSGQLHAPAALPPRETAPGTHYTGSWVGLRACLDDVEKSWPYQDSNSDLGHPARSQSLYWLEKLNEFTWRRNET